MDNGAWRDCALAVVVSDTSRSRAAQLSPNLLTYNKSLDASGTSGLVIYSLFRNVVVSRPRQLYRYVLLLCERVSNFNALFLS